MLKKIINIKNIGLFENAICTSPAFDKATLIYAENGRGKSTLASILRSCATNDTASISNRKTLDSENSPEIKLLFYNGTSPIQTTFDGSQWSNPYSNILVFDTEFVNKNVYSGTAIETNHRQELLEFALGEDAVQLKQQVDSETLKASETQKEITNFQNTLAAYRNGMQLRKFANLQSDPNVDQKINSLEVRLTAAKNNATLQKKECPEALLEPKLDIDKFFNIFSKTLEAIEKNAEQTVRSHINKYSNENFENWLSQGQAFEDDNNCPYCGQALIENDLLTAYKTHFNQAYKDLKVNVANLSENIEKELSDAIVDKLISTVERNQSIADEWTEHLDLQKFELGKLYKLDKDIFLSMFKQIRDLFHELARVKQQNPLEKIGSDSEKNQAQLLWIKVLLEVEKYNQSINILTDKIAEFKRKLDRENIQEIQQQIKELEIVKVRQEQVVCDLIQQWKDAKAAKRSHEQQKEAARNELDSLMTQTLQKYQTKINDLVKKFGALFEICELNHDYRGTGLPRSNYGLKVKGQDVKLSADNAPSFATALSEGDKRTLAFAFFIARIEADANLSSKIIVVDDPVCSLDRSRRNQTKRILRDIGRKSVQLIVLGHDSHFLRDLRDDLEDSRVNISTQLLKINRINNDYSDFSAFDIDKECASSYYRNH